MEYSDSRRIKEIRDNTAKMADAFTRIADALERMIPRAEQTEPNSSEKPNNCEDEPLTCDGNCWMKKQNGEWICEHCQRKPKTEPQTDCAYKEYPCDVCDEQTDCPWK